MRKREFFLIVCFPSIHPCLQTAIIIMCMTVSSLVNLNTENHTSVSLKNSKCSLLNIACAQNRHVRLSSLKRALFALHL